MKNDVADKPCTKTQAKALTERIRQGVDELWSLLLEAHERKAWKALGYETWAAYVGAEFGMTKQRSYQLLDQGRVIESIRQATGEKSTDVDLSEAAARAIKGDLPAVTNEIRMRVAAGEEPRKATTETIAANRAAKEAAKAEREAQQAEWDRGREETRKALSPNIKRGEEAKLKNGSAGGAVAGKAGEDIEAIRAERDELRDENAALKADVVERDQRLAKFDDIAIQWEKGGYDAVRATDQERIRNLQRQVENESADKASWAKRAEWWKKTALSLGYVSANEQIEVPFPEDAAAPF